MISNQLVAHRGWQRQYPENTQFSVENAIRIGAKHIEIDIQLSLDHIPVVYHDKDLMRVSGRPGLIHETSFSELSRYSAHEPGRFDNRFKDNKIFSLQQCVDIIQQHSDITLYAEIKRSAIRSFGTQQVLESILPILAPIAAHCIIISFDIDILHEAKKLGWGSVGPILSGWDDLNNKNITELNARLAFCDEELIPKNFNLSSLEFSLVVYEIDDYSKAASLLKQGASLIETFAIGEMIKEDLKQTT
jgi:glycerophosphoryl diester phosphodiesterase